MKWLVIIVFGAVSALSLADRPEKDSFVNNSIHSMGDLIRQIETDRAVENRYRLHYRLSKSRIAQYFESLRLKRIEDSRSMPVYVMNDQDRESIQDRKLEKGDFVYVNRAGKPVLMAITGDPIESGDGGVLNASNVGKGSSMGSVELSRAEWLALIGGGSAIYGMSTEEVAVPRAHGVPEPTPEPSTYFFLAAGIMGIALGKRRRFGAEAA